MIAKASNSGTTPTRDGPTITASKGNPQTKYAGITNVGNAGGDTTAGINTTVHPAGNKQGAKVPVKTEKEI